MTRFVSSSVGSAVSLALLDTKLQLALRIIQSQRDLYRPYSFSNFNRPAVVLIIDFARNLTTCILYSCIFHVKRQPHLHNMRRTKRNARRIHAPVESALDSINARVTYSRSVQTRSRRNLRSRSIEKPPPRQSSQIRPRDVLREPSPATPRERQTISDYHKRRRKSNRGEPPFLESPSNIWQRLPLAHRMLSLLLGFVSMYYFVFAKHHHYDREIVAIHSDVENLMRHMRDSGFGKNLVEAEVPAIFKEVSTPTPSPTPKKMHNKKKDKGEETKEKLPLEVKKSEKKKKKTEGKSTSSSPIDLEKRSPTQAKVQKSDSNVAPKQKKVEPSFNDADAAKKTKESNVVDTHSSAINATVGDVSALRRDAADGHDERSGVDQVVVPGRAPADASVAPAQENSTVHAENTHAVVAAAGVVAGQGNSMVQSPALPMQSTNSQGGGTVPGSPPLTTSAMVETQTGFANANAGRDVAASRGYAKPEELYDYSNEFKDIEANDPSLPKDHVPLLDWNYEAVVNPKTAEQIFGVGNKLDHVAAYKPLCINPTSEEAIVFAGKRVCSGFNRTAGWLWHYCNVMKESLKKEYLLAVSSEERSKEWLQEKASSIHWVNGLTILQVLEKNCGNIAHFSGRALMLHHILENIAAYAAPPSAIENILIVPTYHIMKRFLYPHNYGFWHKSLLTSLAAPAHFTIGTLGNFLYREHKESYNGTQRVQLLHNFSIGGSVAEGKEYVCFRRAIVPGYLKARFFVDDAEYPSKKPSLQSSVAGAPHIPRDSLRLRERVSAVFHQTPRFSGMRKEVVFLDRSGSRRVFAPDTKVQIIELFQRVAVEKGYTFKVVSFNNMTFKEQYNTMEGVALAVGIHGANLVNTMFMPPLAVLIELFPFGFMHEMYINGGNAGLKYFKYQMATGLPFKGPKTYQSVEQCIKYNQDCKVHYRDSVLQVTQTDLTAMEALLREAMTWCDAIQQSSTPSGDRGNKRSTRRRRRRLLRDYVSARQGEVRSH